MKEQIIKAPEEFLSRGTGNFINCTDYDDAIQAIKDYHAQFSISAEAEIRIAERLPSEEALKEAFWAGRDYQMSLYRFHGGPKGEVPCFSEWFRNRMTEGGKECAD